MTGTSETIQELPGTHRLRMVVSLADQFMVSGTRFVTTWMIARFCGTEQLGLFALGFSVFVLLDLLQQAFVAAPYTVFAQRVAHGRSASLRAAEYTGTTLLFAIAISLGATALFLVLAFVAVLASQGALAQVFLALAIASSFCLLREFLRRQCFSSGQFVLAFLIDLLCSATQLAGLLLLFQFERLDASAAHLCAGAACVAGGLLWSLRTEVKFSFVRWRLYLRKHWRFGRWLFVTQTVNQLSWNVVYWIIAWQLSTEATGVYAGCLTIVFLSNPIVLGIANMLYPRLANEYTALGEAAMNVVARKATLWMACMMSMFTLAMALGGQWICVWLYDDPAYLGSTVVLVALAAAVASLAATVPIDGCLWAKQRTDLSSVASGLGMVVSVLSVLFLVRYGISGAAIGLMIGCWVESLARLFLFGNWHKLFQQRFAMAS